MESLQILSLDGTAIMTLPFSIKNAINLKYAGLKGTGIRQKWWIYPSIIDYMIQKPFYVNGATIDRSNNLAAQLEKISVRDCPALRKCVDKSEALSFLFDVRLLDLSGNNFERLPKLGQFRKLEELHISYCQRLKSLPELPPHLQRLNARYCTSLESIGKFPLQWKRINILKYSYNFINCFNLIKDASSEIVANAHRTIELIAAATSIERLPSKK
ncbi:Leucine rich repeat 4, partial [Corchorus olitorius]